MAIVKLWEHAKGATFEMESGNEGANLRVELSGSEITFCIRSVQDAERIGRMLAFTLLNAADRSDRCAVIVAALRHGFTQEYESQSPDFDPAASTFKQ